jgi:hypothetical protein
MSRGVLRDRRQRAQGGVTACRHGAAAPSTPTATHRGGGTSVLVSRCGSSERTPPSLTMLSLAAALPEERLISALATASSRTSWSERSSSISGRSTCEAMSFSRWNSTCGGGRGACAHTSSVLGTHARMYRRRHACERVCAWPAHASVMHATARRACVLHVRAIRSAEIPAR